MTERMVHLTTVASPFHGRVLAARLGAEGILTDLRGAVSGTYPLPGLVEVWVEEPAAPLALGLLDADQAASVATGPLATGPRDARLGDPGSSGDTAGPGATAPRAHRGRDALVRPRPFGQRLTWLVAALLLAVALLSAVRLG